MRARLFLLLLSGLFTGLARADDSVVLHFLQKGSGSAIHRVEVKTPDGKSISSDKKGEVTLPVPAGAGHVDVYRAGFEPQAITYEELRGKATFDVYLLPATPGDNEVLVRGNKRPEVSRKTVSIEEAVKVAPGGDPAQIPKLLPGVQSKGFQPDIVVRGSAPEDSLYYIDNFRVPFIFHRLGNISIIPEQLLSDVEFSSGGFGPEYGDATGGVITLRTKNEIPERARTEAKVNIPLYSALYHEEPVNDGKDLFAASVRRSYLELFLGPILKAQAKKNGGDGGSLTVSPYFDDVHAYWVHPTEDGHIKVLGLWAEDGLKALFPTDASTGEDGRGEFAFRDTAAVFGVEWKKSIDKAWSLTVAPELFNQSSHFDFVGNHFDIGINGFRLKTEAVRRLEGKDKLYVGFEGDQAYVHVGLFAPRFDSSDPFFDFETAPKVKTSIHQTYTDLATWVAVDQTFGALTLTPGLRPFYDSSIKKSSADPRLSARYQLTEQHALKAAVGQYSEAPQPQDSAPDYGNPSLKFIRAYHYVLGVDSNWEERWTTDFQVYYKDAKELVRSDPVLHKNNSGSLTSRGFEAFIRRNLTERLFGWVSYTYSQTRERDDDSEAFRQAQYDETHVLQATGNYKLTGQWAVGGRMLYHTGDTFTPVDYAVYNADLDKYQQRDNPGTKANSDRLPPYHEFDVFVDKDYLYDTWKLTVRYGLEYLALSPQAQGVQYNYDYSKKDYFKGVPTIPYIELKGVF